MLPRRSEASLVTFVIYAGVQSHPRPRRREASTLDRAPIVEFLNIKPEMQRDEVQFRCEFSERRPRILGALLDAA